MRLDRSITLGLVQPLRRLMGAQHSSAPALHHSISAIPVLMYHSISDDPEPGVSPYYRVNTAPAVFARQMQHLADHGYRAISLQELVTHPGTPGCAAHGCSSLPRRSEAELGPAARHSNTPTLQHSITPSPRSVCLTFDDGFRNFYTDAFPVLQRHGFTATVFLPTAFIGEERRQFRPAGSTLSTLNSQLSTRKDCLTWSEVRELHRAGVQFGSHTVTHPKLVELDWPEIEIELLKSKTEIQDRLQAPVTSFCYPYAFPQGEIDFVRRFTGLLSETGYTSCATTIVGRASPAGFGASAFSLQPSAFLYQRLPVNSSDDPALFAAKLAGAYDWLGPVQALSKKLRPRRRDHASTGSTPVRQPRPATSMQSPVNSANDQ